MDVSKKTDYALRMLAALVRDPSGVVSVRTAARENGVPYSFARSIQHDLAVAGIVENARGATGGMRLAVDPRETTLLQLVEAVQGPVIIAGCHGSAGSGEPCPNLATCHFSPVWCNAERLLRSFFSAVTLYQAVVEGRSPLFDGGFRLVGLDEARAAAHGDVPPVPSDAGEKDVLAEAPRRSGMLDGGDVV
ncbi:RrF2 family transcriptional regulator [Olsenella profusa]|uniref:Rrf2 family transcriptional regulator n=1 Tax=Olsenella profusa TaxID=138595 RepID=A0ABS2F3H1_9ACTN|nr:Rrf2 family transcriptional regulator [Olsenella profusa]MBM6775378.1 Rrf2 family transcriptional regulator [Olsenella profusa]